MLRESNGPIRILQVVGSLNRGGTEAWLLHVLKHIDRSRFQIDFLVFSDAAGELDNQVRAQGSNIIVCPNPGNPALFGINFRHVIREHGRYDIVHSHVGHFSGYVIFLSRMFGIPSRIAHSHNSSALHGKQEPFPRGMYLRAMRQVLSLNLTLGLAASKQAAESLYGPHWRTDRRFRVLHCGIDLDGFAAVRSGHYLRADLGIAPDAKVVGHVGRFQPVKNHEFLVEVASELVRRNSTFHFLFVGDGPTRPKIQQLVQSRGLSAHVTFAGSRQDVPLLLTGLIDVFVMPSVSEGLGLSLVEAQAAGLPCVVSEAIPHEADVVPGLVSRLPIHSVSAWSEQIASEVKRVEIPPPEESLRIVQKSSFNILRSAEALSAVYESQYASITD